MCPLYTGQGKSQNVLAISREFSIWGTMLINCKAWWSRTNSCQHQAITHSSGFIHSLIQIGALITVYTRLPVMDAVMRLRRSLHSQMHCSASMKQQCLGGQCWGCTGHSSLFSWLQCASHQFYFLPSVWPILVRPDISKFNMKYIKVEK